MLTRFIKIQLVVFTILTIIALVVLGWYYLRLPSVAGIGQYKLYADLPRSGGLYSTANVTYLGTQIGKVTDVVPTERGARATMSIDSDIKIPADATANVHSVSAIGEQYLDLVSTSDTQGKYLAAGHDDHQQHRAQRGRPRARRREQRSRGAAEGEDRLAADGDVAGRRRPGPGAAASRRLHDGDRERLQGQPRSGQRRHQQLDADPGQPGQLR